MSEWKSVKGRELLRALLRNGWEIARVRGSHHTLQKSGFENYVFSFRDSEEIGPNMVARVAKKTGLRPEDL